MKYLRIFCLPLLFCLGQSVAAQQLAPGEGEIELDSFASNFEAGYYDIRASVRVTLRYRLSMLLGDHVELFQPRVEVNNADIYSPDGELVFSVIKSGTDGSVLSTGNRGVPDFYVGAQAMEKLLPVSMSFRLTEIDFLRGYYELERDFPGVFFAENRWGWDFPASARWGNILSFGSDGRKQSVSAEDARQKWAEWMSTTNPLGSGELTYLSFDVSRLMAEIARQIPDAFRNSNGVSPAFSQMASLAGQLKSADPASPDYDRRRSLTNRARSLLESDMSAQEREIIESMLGASEADEEDLAALQALYDDAAAQYQGGAEALPPAIQNELNAALGYYTSQRLQQLKLPSSVRATLEKLSDGAINWSELVVARNPSNSSLEGIRSPKGEWLLEPEYEELIWIEGARFACAAPPGQDRMLVELSSSGTESVLASNSYCRRLHNSYLLHHDETDQAGLIELYSANGERLFSANARGVSYSDYDEDYEFFVYDRIESDSRGSCRGRDIIYYGEFIDAEGRRLRSGTQSDYIPQICLSR